MSEQSSTNAVSVCVSKKGDIGGALSSPSDSMRELNLGMIDSKSHLQKHKLTENKVF